MLDYVPRTSRRTLDMDTLAFLTCVESKCVLLWTRVLYFLVLLARENCKTCISRTICAIFCSSNHVVFHCRHNLLLELSTIADTTTSYR